MQSLLGYMQRSLEKRYNTFFYLLLTSFHHTQPCSSVKQISDKNKQTYTGSRDDLISQGYAPARNATCKQKRATDPHQK